MQKCKNAKIIIKKLLLKIIYKKLKFTLYN